MMRKITMIDSRRLEGERATLSDAAVDGLFRGILAGIVMAFVLVLGAFFGGDNPAVMLGRFGTGDENTAASGTLLHLSVSGVYGILFGLGWWLLGLRQRNRWLTLLFGLVYGVLLSLGARLIVPATDSPLQEIAPSHFAIAHLVFGSMLGLLFVRRHWKDGATPRDL
jgi:hypothetical protein